MAACRKISFFESLDFTLGARSIIMGRKIRGKLSGGYEKGRMEESMSKMTEQKQDRLIIVIPAYNEEENIENVVSQWHPIVEKTGADSRLFIINDGSTDHTQEKLESLQEKYPQLRTVKKENQGHGATILYGYRCAIAEGADYIFQTDSDGQTVPEEFWKLWADREKCGLLIGSRKKRQDGWRRIFVTRVLRLVILATFHCWVEDANTPFRLMRASELEEVLQEIPLQYFLSNVLMTVRYTKEKRHVAYYPITFRPRQGGINSINMKKIVGIGKTTLRDFWKWGGERQ